MVKSSVSILLALAVFVTVVPDLQCQDAESSMFYSNPILSNPAYTGSSGRSAIVLSYRDYFPGMGFNVGSLYGSWDSFIEPLHGGVGVYLFENRLGNILNDLRTGATYSYHLRAGRELFINAGFMASVIHRSLNTDYIVMPDQIDPLLGPVLPSGQITEFRSRTIFDTGIGFLLIYRNYTGGISLNHIAAPDLTGSGIADSRLPRRISMHVSASYSFKDSEMCLEPLFAASYQGGVFVAEAGIIYGCNILNINVVAHTDSRQGLSAIQSGIFVEKGLLGIGYNHYFNPGVAGTFVTSSLSSQVTLWVGLYNVEKRGVIRTIKYPKL